VQGVLRRGAAVRKPDRGERGTTGAADRRGEAPDAPGALGPEAVIRGGLSSEGEAGGWQAGGAGGAELVGPASGGGRRAGGGVGRGVGVGGDDPQGSQSAPVGLAEEGGAVGRERVEDLREGPARGRAGGRGGAERPVE